MRFSRKALASESSRWRLAFRTTRATDSENMRRSSRSLGSSSRPVSTTRAPRRRPCATSGNTARTVASAPTGSRGSRRTCTRSYPAPCWSCSVIAASVRSRAGSTSTAVEICRRISPWTARSDCSAACRAEAVRSADVRTAVTIRSVTGRSAARAGAPGTGARRWYRARWAVDPRQPLVHHRHEDGRLEAAGVELGRPRQRPGEPGPGSDGLPHRGERRPPGGDHRVTGLGGQLGVHDHGRLGAQEGRRRGAGHALSLVQDGAQEPGEVAAALDGIPPLREVAHLADQRRQGAPRPVEALPTPGERPLRGFLELPRRERLHEVVHGAEAHRSLHGVERRVGRDHHDLHPRIERLHALEELDAVHPRHLHVHEDHVRAHRRQDGQHLLAAPGREDLVARLEDHADGLAWAFLVVDDQDARIGHAGHLLGRLTGSCVAA